MKITVNGKNTEVSGNISVHEYLTQKGIPLEHVVIELNKEILNRNIYNKIKLKNGDTVEILQLVGGG